MEEDVSTDVKSNNSKVAALIELADIFICASNDLHTAHLNMRGRGFDRMHKKVLLAYYEELASDYDAAAEFAGCFDAAIPNANDAASRISWKSFDGFVGYDSAVVLINEVLTFLCDKLVILYNAFNSFENCSICIGITNWLQGRIEYWTKELNYFNRRRFEQ